MTLVGVGEVSVVEDEKSGSDGATGDEEWKSDAVERNAAGFEGNDFVVFAENAESNENGDERAERSELVDGVGNKITEIAEDDHEGDIVAANVFREFEKGKDFEKEDKGDHDDDEEVEKAAKDVEIEDGRKAGVGRLRGDTVFGAGGATRAEAGAAAKESPERGKAGDKLGSGNVSAVALHAGEKRDSGESDDNVCGPNADKRREESLTSEAGTGDQDEVVGSDDDDGEERTSRATAATRLRAERNSDEGEYETGGRESQALIELDASIAPGGSAFFPKLTERALGHGDGTLFGGKHGGKFHGPIGAAEGSDGIVIGSETREFVGGTVVEMEFEFAEGWFGNDNRRFRESDLGIVVRARLSEEDAVPVCAGGGNVANIEDEMGEALVEDTGLNGEGDLGSDEGSFDVASDAEGERGEPGGHEESEGGAEDGQDADGNENAFAGNAESGEGDDFGVHGHAAETEQDTDEHGHGDGEDEDAGNDAEEERGDLRARAGVADENLHELDEFGNEKNESENEEPEEGVADNFAGDITVEKAHVRKGECNMGWAL